MRPPFFHDDNGDFKNERLEAFKTTIDKYDIICLQECFGAFNYRRDKLIRYAKSVGFEYHAIGPERNIFKGKYADSGLLILSRFEILESRTIQFSNSVNTDRFAAKGSMYVKLDVYGSPYYVFNTHTQASYTENLTESDVGVMVRKTQLSQIKEFIENAIQKEDKVIVVGDFNVNSRLYPWEYERLLNTIQMNDIVYDTFREHPITCYPWQYRFEGVPLPWELESLDYIFAQNIKPKSITIHTEEYKTKWKHLSDHFGVEMIFE